MGRRSYDRAKRGFDICVSAIGILITAPIQIIVATLVWKDLGSPVIFRQSRPGKDGKVFKLLKFRSMKDVDEARGLITNEDRVTKFGNFIRTTSLDELPSLLNILKGEMSLVGPRPLRVEYLPLYSSQQARRHEVRPGLTGLAQVSGRNALEWEDRFALDVQYVDKRSFILDLQIIIKTAVKVFQRDGISSDGIVGSRPFLGTDTKEASK